MRTLMLLLLLSLIATPTLAQDRNVFIQGFGGLRATSAPVAAGSLGGTVGAGLTPNIQAVGEVGWLSDVLPPAIDTALAFSPVRFRVSAFYGEGGVRFTTNSRGPIAGYVETLAGFSRLNNRIGGLGSPGTGAIVNTALRFVDTTNPLAAVGGGVILQGGPLMLTVGYRFSRIFANDAIASVLTGGRLDINEVRLGVGVRF